MPPKQSGLLTPGELVHDAIADVDGTFVDAIHGPDHVQQRRLSRRLLASGRGIAGGILAQGSHALKGVPGEWRLYAISSSNTFGVIGA